MPYLVDIQQSFPKHYYSQEELIEQISKAWSKKIRNLSRVKSIHQNVLVKGRHLAIPLDEYFKFDSFDQKNNLFIQEATRLAQNAIHEIFKNNNILASEVHSLWSNTVTGFSIPSLEARVMNLIDFPNDTKRVPLMGLGCMAGVAGINRIADYLVGNPRDAVIFFSVELCSLTIQSKDISAANLVSTGLFGDGAAAVLMVGDEHSLANTAPLKWLSSKSIFFPNTEDVMGWSVGEQGLKIILSKSVPDVTEKKLAEPLRLFLEDNSLELADIQSFFAHPGGPKVLYAMEKVLDLPQGGLKHSWDSLAQNGNMSSVSVLDIFKRNIIHRPCHLKKSHALSIAMGPAFSAELGLFQWI